MADKYEIRYKKVKRVFKNVEIEYEEQYAYNPETKEEIYKKEFLNVNRNNLYEAYKLHMGLLTGNDIKDIRKKYGMTQKEYAFALGFGEITVHRFEKGSVQSYADDEIMRLSSDPDDMYKLLSNNKDSFNEETYIGLMENVKDLQKHKRNKVAKFDKNQISHLTAVTTDVIDVAKCLAKKYNHQYDWLDVDTPDISVTKLSKLLYFVQGLSLYIYNTPAFYETVTVSKLGPEIKEITKEFSNNQQVSVNDDVYLSNGLNKIIDIVIESYGQLELLLLVRIAKEEEPIRSKQIGEVIELEEMLKYFTKIYSSY